MQNITNREYAVNKLKLTRAVVKATEEAKQAGNPVNEDRIKELYIAFGGRVVEKAAATGETGEEETDEEVAPRKRGKKVVSEEE